MPLRARVNLLKAADRVQVFVQPREREALVPLAQQNVCCRSLLRDDGCQQVQQFGGGGVRVGHTGKLPQARNKGAYALEPDLTKSTQACTGDACLSAHYLLGTSPLLKSPSGVFVTRRSTPLPSFRGSGLNWVRSVTIRAGSFSTGRLTQPPVPTMPVAVM